LHLAASVHAPRAEPAAPPRQTRCPDCCWCPCLKSKEQLVARFRRWWYVTTDVDFLTANATRRNMWKILLPAAGVLAMISDVGFSNLVILDAYATVALLVVSYLPSAWLCSDLVIAMVHVVFYSSHSILVARLRLQLSEEDADPQGEPWTCQVLSVFTMASAGVHSFALAGFTGTTVACSYFLQIDGSVEQLLACCYVLAVAWMAERRLAQLIYDVQGTDLGYNALKLSCDRDSLAPDSPRYSTEPLMAKSEAEPPVTEADGALHYTVGSGGEEEESQEESIQTAAPVTQSRASLADLVLSHLRPKETSRRFSRAEEVLSSFPPVLSHPRPRFAASQVQLPAAATHDAPLFVEKLEIEGIENTCSASNYLLYSPSAPSTARSSEPQARFAPALDDNERSRSPGRSRSPNRPSTPRSSPPSASADQQLVLRGIKMHGFRTPQLNVLFIENRDASTKVNGRETYWTEAGDYFLYFSKATDTWGLAKSRRFQAVIDGTSNGVAHSPEKYEIWDSPSGRKQAARTLGNWREWDAKVSKWVPRLNSGIENRGRVRPKVAPPLEKAVQTEVDVKDNHSQTDPPHD